MSGTTAGAKAMNEPRGGETEVSAARAYYSAGREPANGNGPPTSPGKSFFAHIIAMRRSRDRIFGPGLFGEPAWDILLHLMVARFDERGMTVHQIAEATGQPENTTIRYIEAMVADDLLERDNQPIAPREGIVRLSDSAAKAMLTFFQESPAISRPPA